MKGYAESTCATFCVEDVTDKHDMKEPKPITANEDFRGFAMQPSCTCGKRKDFGRIVGGTEAFNNEFPWLAAIVFKGSAAYARKPFCGGSLINDRYIVSAAHCFVPDQIQAYEVQVVLHAHVMDKRTRSNDRQYMEIPGWDRPDETDSSEQSLRVDVEAIISHPLFDEETFDWDVSILKLKQRVNFKTAKVSPICLPRISELFNYHDGELHTVAGWGRHKEDAKAPSRIPMKLDTPFVNHRKCTHYTFPADRHLCAGYNEGGKDACAGDSGGPLIYKFNPSNNQYLLSGVVSAGEGCARRGKVGVYTNMMDVIQWIYHQTSDAEWCNR